MWQFLRNLSLTTKAFILIALTTVILATIAFAWLHTKFPLPNEEALRASYLAQYVALIKVIAVGVFVALVSAIIPLLLPEARDRFEQFKESRLAYSRAKTSIIYLPDRVISEGEEMAAQLVAEAHRELHYAETFQDVIIDKGYLKWFANPDLWVSYNYWQIVAVAKVLRSFDWHIPDDKPKLRKQLHHTLKVVHDRFGERGENCRGEQWRIEDDTRFTEEDKLEALIDATLNEANAKAIGERTIS